MAICVKHWHPSLVKLPDKEIKVFITSLTESRLFSLGQVRTDKGIEYEWSFLIGCKSPQNENLNY